MSNDHTLSSAKIAVIGLGYVGLPLALELAKYNDLIGFDVDQARIQELKKNNDRNAETPESDLKNSRCTFTDQMEDIAQCQIYIVTVPTPIDEENTPDLSILESASKSIGKILKKGNIVVYESTVYPGVTEDICGPILQKESGLICGEDFFLGYSPERINPGDREHTLDKIAKVVAGQTPEISTRLVKLYGQINNGNIFEAANIKTAEASKAIENAQRDINVAFINEVTVVLNKLGLSSYDVLEAAGTKWNFLPFTPGLVGGHCIGVDPYYLAKCATDIGYSPDVILSGRKINDSMGFYVAQTIHDSMIKRDVKKQNAKILVLGFTFKENISDIRNTKVIDIIKDLDHSGYDLTVHDPYAWPEQVKKHYDFELTQALPEQGGYDAIILCVSHKGYTEMSADDLEALLKDKSGLIYDIKGLWRNLAFSDSVDYQCL